MRQSLLILLAIFPTITLAQPNIGEILEISHSLVQVSVDLGDGRTGTGSGVVVSKEYVATNCHVIANGKGADITKLGSVYTPIAIKADWKHDLCLLKFDNLNIKPVPLRESASLAYEEDIFSLGYPIGNNIPQPSFGVIKAKYRFDDNFIIRTDAAFGLGSSGGALFDQQFNLIGITTFKSSGPQGYFYNLPADWIKKLMDGPELHSLKTKEVPFWALPQEEKPYFMQVVIPFQNHEWAVVKEIANQWTAKENFSADAWYFLAKAEMGLNQTSEAKTHLQLAESINHQDLDVLIALSEIAYLEKDVKTLESLNFKISSINPDESETISKWINTLKNN